MALGGVPPVEGRQYIDSSLKKSNTVITVYDEVRANESQMRGDEHQGHAPRKGAHIAAWDVKDVPGVGSIDLATEDNTFNESCFAKIANNEYFQNLTLSIITLNALWISVDTEWNHSVLEKADGSLPLEPFSTGVENFFCGYFTIEVLLRFFSYRRKRYCLADKWFVFDTFLVAFMILETWLLPLIETLTAQEGGSSLSSFSALRLLRLLRLTRMVRLMRHVPELMILCKGIVAATQAVFFILLFLVLVMYVFAIIFTSSIGKPNSPECDEESEDFNPDSAKYIFGSMGDSMMTLFTNGVLGDNLNATTAAILEEGLFMFWVFNAFFAISSMTLLNMLVGVLCEVIAGTAEEEMNTINEYAIRECLEVAFNDLDENHDGMVSKAEWHAIKTNPKILGPFTAAGWDPDRIGEELDGMEKVIFQKKAGREGTISLSMDDLCAKVIEVRPGKPACVLDLQLCLAKHGNNNRRINSELRVIEKEFAALLTKQNLPVPDFEKPKRHDHPSSKPEMKGVSTEQLLEALKSRVSQSPPQLGMPGSGPPPRKIKAPKEPDVPAPKDPSIWNQRVDFMPIVGVAEGYDPMTPIAEVLSPSMPRDKPRKLLPDFESEAASLSSAPPLPPREFLAEPREDSMPGASLADNRVLSFSMPSDNALRSSADGLRCPGVDRRPLPKQISDGDDGSQQSEEYDPEKGESEDSEENVPPPVVAASGRKRVSMAMQLQMDIQNGVPISLNKAQSIKRQDSMKSNPSRDERGELQLWKYQRPVSRDAARRADLDASTDIMSKQTLALVQQDRVLVQHHPLFVQLLHRDPPGGWMVVRCVVTQLENGPLTLPELCKRSRMRSETEVKVLLLALPDLFEVRGSPALAETRFLDTHVGGCPWYDANTLAAFDESHYGNKRCHCVWRLCDALQQVHDSNPKVGGTSRSLWGCGVTPPQKPARSRDQFSEEAAARNNAKTGQKNNMHSERRARPVHDLQSGRPDTR